MARTSKIRRIFLSAYEQLKPIGEKARNYDSDFYDIADALINATRANPYRDKFMAVNAVASAWHLLTCDHDGPHEGEEYECSELCNGAEQFMAFYLLGRTHASEENVEKKSKKKERDQ